MATVSQPVWDMALRQLKRKSSGLRGFGGDFLTSLWDGHRRPCVFWKEKSGEFVDVCGLMI